MTGEQLKIMLEGLIATAVEKICVLGWEDGYEDAEKIIGLIEDLEMFWDSEGDITGTDWTLKAKKAIAKVK